MSGEHAATIKEKVEKNPFVYLISVFCAAVVAAGGVTAYFCAQHIESLKETSAHEIGVLQSELTSIKRGVGDNKFLDIRTFLYPKDSSPSPAINSKSKYISSEDFYAITDLPGWEYLKLTHKQFYSRAYGIGFSSGPLKQIEDLPVHSWHPSEGFISVESENFGDVGPMIVVDRMHLNKLLERSIEGLPEMVEEEKRQNRPTEGLTEWREMLERTFQGDVAEHMLSTWMMLHLGAGLKAPEVNSSLVEVQKVGNVVYGQFLTKVRNPEVNGKRMAAYFVRHEFILITDREYVTSIDIVVPSAEPSPRGPVYSRIQEWFSGLAIPVS